MPLPHFGQTKWSCSIFVTGFTSIITLNAGGFLDLELAESSVRLLTAEASSELNNTFSHVEQKALSPGGAVGNEATLSLVSAPRFGAALLSGVL